MNRRVACTIGAVLLLILPVTGTQAQTPHVWGIRAGVNSSTFDFPVFDLHHRLGINLAICRQIIHTRVYSLDIEFEYAQRGYTDKQVRTGGSGEFLGIMKAVTRLDYFSVPLLLRISVPTFKTVQPYVITGPSFEFRFNRKKGVWDYLLEDTLSDQFRRSSLSVTVGVGAELPDLFATTIRIEVRHSFSVTDVLRSDSLWEQQVTMKSTGLFLTILK